MNELRLEVWLLVSHCPINNRGKKALVQIQVAGTSLFSRKSVQLNHAPITHISKSTKSNIVHMHEKGYKNLFNDPDFQHTKTNSVTVLFSTVTTRSGHPGKIILKKSLCLSKIREPLEDKY